MDHVWSNLHVFLAGGRMAATCQLGGDRLGRQLADLAGWLLVGARAGLLERLRPAGTGHQQTVVLAALPCLQQPAFLVRLTDLQFAAGFRAAFVLSGWLANLCRDALVASFRRTGVPLGWLPAAVTMYLVRQVLPSTDSPRSVAGWGSVLRALAVSPATWADQFGDRRTFVTKASRG